MRRSQNPLQQALVGVAVMVCIAVTLLCGVVLAFGDRLRVDSGIAGRPTATVFHIATLPPKGSASKTPLPTSVAEATLIVIPTTTRVPTREASPTPAPTDTDTPRPSPTSPPIAVCNPPTNWVSYRVQSGETLYQIGLRYNLTVDQMMNANCLTNERIDAGELLRVPPSAPRVSPTKTAVPPTAGNPSLPTPKPGPTGTQSTTDGACTSPDSFISSPRVGQEVSGVIQIRGTARLSNFAFYKLEIRREGASTVQDYVTFFTGQEPVTNGVLATLNTATYPDGEYWLRLVVVDSTGNYPERCAILFPFNNN